jgi:hypothetical protein
LGAIDAIKGTMTDTQITDAVVARKKCANQAWRFFRTYGGAPAPRGGNGHEAQKFGVLILARMAPRKYRNP